MMLKISSILILQILLALNSCYTDEDYQNGKLIATFDYFEKEPGGTYMIVKLESQLIDTVAMVFTGFVETSMLNEETTGCLIYDTEIIVEQGEKIVSSKDIPYEGHIYVDDYPKLFMLYPYEPVSIFITYFGDLRRDFGLDWRPFEVRLVLHPTNRYVLERVNENDSAYIRNHPGLKFIDTTITTLPRVKIF
jgi:hypothetical protein